MANSNQRVVEGARLSGQGHRKGTLVEFDQDVFPHVVGEVKRLGQDELARVDEVAKSRNIKGAVYHKYELTGDDKQAAKRDEEAADKAKAKDEAKS